jgi:hypothetical protein
MRAAEGQASWDAATLGSDTSWIFNLSKAALGEVERAGKAVLESGLPLRDIGADKLPMPGLRKEFEAMGRQLSEGRGVLLVRGLKAVELGAKEMRAQLWALGTCLGVGVSQNPRGHYLGEVIDLSDQQDSARPFQRGGELLMHRDPIDVVGLLCVRHAKAGGLSRVASAAHIHNLILKERPDLLPALYEGFVYHRLDEDRGDTAAFTPHRVPVYARGESGALSCHFIPQPIDRAAKHGFALDARQREAIDFFVEVAKRPGVYFDMNLMPGEVQFLNNRAILHARTDYEDFPELERRRHMLRLWLMMPAWAPAPATQKFYENVDRCGGGIAARATAPSA